MNKNEKKHFYFIAIGGVGMSGLALFLLENGHKVSGSDIAESKYLKNLKEKGAEVYIGHDKSHIKENMIIVASSAVRADNPEIIRAEELNLKIYHRSDILKYISDEYHSRENSVFIGFSGTHGKTTTSGLCSYILEKGQLKPSYVVGGIIPEINTNGKYNGDKFFIAELDESDGTIEKYSTDIAVINNIEEDHLDHYKNGLKDILSTFNKYLSNNPGQKVIINADNSGTIKLMNDYPEYNYITFGINNGDYMAKNIKFDNLSSKFDVYFKNSFVSEIKLSVPGKHNIYNALAVISAIIEAEEDINNFAVFFKSFSGMGRRFQQVGKIANITIYDDYAHHPSEIKTTLDSVKESSGEKRITAIFQPHRYTRLKGFWNEFKKAFDSADKVFVTDVYPAGEEEIEGINSSNFTKELNSEKFEYIKGDIETSAKKISAKLKNGDIVITLGAGNITKMGSCLIKAMEFDKSDRNI